MRDSELETQSSSEFFGFYVTPDGEAIFTVAADGGLLQFTMSSEAAEALGFSFINMATRAKALSEDSSTFVPTARLAKAEPDEPEDATVLDFPAQPRCIN